MTIPDICLLLEQHGGIDLFLQEGKPPLTRIDGELQSISNSPLEREVLLQFWAECGAPAESQDFDVAYTAPTGTRYRASLYLHMGRHGAVLRRLKTSVPTMEELGLPASLLSDWLLRKAGLILVTGPTGSGKTTSVAAMLEWINHHVSRHIITIEDPIEYLFEDHTSLFSRREVGMDTQSYLSGLKHALRQSPDVIMLGEIRDVLTAATTLQACETGHLVIATLHSSSAVEALERFTRLFGQEEREGVSMVLGAQLLGVIDQRLIAGIDGAFHLAAEHFENQGVSRRYIQENRWKELMDLVQRDDNPANRSLLRSLVALVQEGRIEEESARRQLHNPQDLQRAMKGILSNGGR